MPVHDADNNSLARGDDVLYLGQGVWKITHITGDGVLSLHNAHRDRHAFADPSDVYLHN